MDLILLLVVIDNSLKKAERIAGYFFRFLINMKSLLRYGVVVFLNHSIGLGIDEHEQCKGYC